MSASVPAPAVPGGLRATTLRVRLEHLRHAAGLGTALFTGLSLVAFLTTGGEALAANTWVEIALVLIGVAAACALVLLPKPAPRAGGISFALFAALAALTALSVLWSVQPATSWIEANRTLAYLSAFGTAIALARLLGTRWGAVTGALTAYCALIAGYALLVKVFPGALDPGDTIGRLSAPFDYWNATGVVAAMGLPAALWAGARRERARLSRGLSVPILGLEISVVVLSYSRGAVLAAIASLATWFVLVPLRLRSVAVLCAGAAGGAAISLWALHTHALTHDRIPLGQRISAGQGFGVLLVCVCLTLALIGVAIAFAADRVLTTPGFRRRVGRALVGAVCLLPALGLVGLAASSRGFTGEVSHIWSSLTTTGGHVSDNPGRLAQLSSTRPLYWREGLKVGEHNLLDGTGALGYAVAKLRYAKDPYGATHAHSYLIETFADFGLLGLLLSLGLLTAWGLAAWRVLRIAQGEAQRAAGGVMLAVVMAFGIQSAIDWTWFVPGVTIPALLCAGWLAGWSPVTGGAVRRMRLSRAPGRTLALVALLSAGLLAAWAIWQPLRSQQAAASSIADATALDTRDAIALARTAADDDPVSVEPLVQLSALYLSVHQPAMARAALEEAVSRQPSNPFTYQALGSYDFNHRMYREAVADLQSFLTLDPSDLDGLQLLQQAQQKVAAGAQ